MPRYQIAGYEEYPVLHLSPAEGGQGVELPSLLYARWRQARDELEAAQREVIAYLRDLGGREAIPEELWEPRDRLDLPSLTVGPWDGR